MSLKERFKIHPLFSLPSRFHVTKSQVVHVNLRHRAFPLSVLQYLISPVTILKKIIPPIPMLKNHLPSTYTNKTNCPTSANFCGKLEGCKYSKREIINYVFLYHPKALDPIEFKHFNARTVER